MQGVTATDLNLRCQSPRSLVNNSASPKDTWMASPDGTQLLLDCLIDDSPDGRDLQYIGSIFESRKWRLTLSTEQRRQIGGNRTPSNAESHDVLAKNYCLPDVSKDYNSDRPTTHLLGYSVELHKAPRQSRADEILEETFRLLFKSSPNILALYGYVLRSNDNSSSLSRGSSDGPRNPVASTGVENSEKGNDHAGDDKSNQDNQDDQDRGDKNDKIGKPSARKRYLDGFPDPEFLCVMFVGDPDRALAASCAFHNPSIAEIYRVIMQHHKRGALLTSSSICSEFITSSIRRSIRRCGSSSKPTSQLRVHVSIPSLSGRRGMDCFFIAEKLCLARGIVRVNQRT